MAYRGGVVPAESQRNLFPICTGDALWSSSAGLFTWHDPESSLTLRLLRNCKCFAATLGFITQISVDSCTYVSAALSLGYASEGEQTKKHEF